MNVNRWVVVISLSTFLCLIVVCGFGLFIFQPQQHAILTSEYVMTVIPAPESTPNLEYLVFKTPTSENNNAVIDTQGINISSVVQIFNTDGAGLRLREGPGVSMPVRFIALDSELFEVIKGPEESDGYIWWYLASPYDENRSGWAASDYLEIIHQSP